VAIGDDQNLLRLLEEYVGRCGLELRCEPLASQEDTFQTRGGLCTLNERRVVFVDPRAPIPERIAALAGALASLDLGDVFLPPLVRRAIEAAQASRLPWNTRRPQPLESSDKEIK
jgi:hypothetical protein